MSRTSKVLLVLILALLALATVRAWDRILLLAAWGLPERTGAEMLVIAHRGNMEAFPEDTAEAIWDAARLGADGIEFDVHRSADGTWWVMHDATVDRTTDGTGFVHELSDLQLQALRIDAGPGFDPNDSTVVRPPRLARVIGGLRRYEGVLFLDLQHAVSDADPAHLVSQVSAVARRLQVIVICRDESDIRAVHSTNPAVQAIIRPDRIGGGTDADGYLLESFTEVSTEGIHDLGRPATTYTDEAFGFFGEAAVLKRAWATGVHAFLAKRLESAMKLRDELATSDDVGAGD